MSHNTIVTDVDDEDASGCVCAQMEIPKYAYLNENDGKRKYLNPIVGEKVSCGLCKHSLQMEVSH